MKTRVNFACITSLICLSVLAFTSRLSAGMITSPAVNANFSNTSGHTDVTVRVNAPAGTASIDYYINGYQVTGEPTKYYEETNGFANADDYFEDYNQEDFEFKFLQGGTYIVEVDARNSAGSVIDSDTVKFTVDFYSLPDRYNFRRMNEGKAIIDKQTFIDAGATRESQYSGEYEYDNMNGPTVIRVPEWVTNRPHASAQYYCYFAGHRGNAIYMAWAANIEGPWNLFNMGAEVDNDKKGVLAFDNTVREGGIDLPNGLGIREHVSSPEILIDDDNRDIIMYFHSPWYYVSDGRNIEGNSPGNQVTYVVASDDGLTFKKEDIVGCMQEESYLSVFWYENSLYGMGSDGIVKHHPDPLDNLFEPAPGTWSRDKYQSTFYWGNAGVRAIQHDPVGSPRHIKVLLEGDTLFAAYSNDEGIPEALHYVETDLKADGRDTWDRWKQERIDVGNEKVKVIHFLAQAEAGWEGGHFEVVASEPSHRNGGVNQLRDPQLFKDNDGKMYMFYAGQGEDAIGMARLVWGTEEVGNNAPRIQSGATATPATIVIGETTRLNVAASDADGDPLTYTWRKVSGSGVVTFSANGDGASNNTVAAFSTAGTYQLEVAVTDGNGGRATSSVAVVVTGGTGGENTVSFDSPTDGAVFLESQDVVVNLVGSHTGGINSMSLSLNEVWQNPLVISEAPFQWDLGTLSAGDHTLVARLVPVVGEALTARITIKVNASGGNHAPTITGLTASPTTLTLPANTTELTATAEDLDGDTLTYTWSGGAGVAFDPTVGATTTATLPSVAGTYEIQLVVTDGKGGRTTRSTTITVSGGGGGEATVSFDSLADGDELPSGQNVVVTVNAGPVGDISKVRLKVNGVWEIDDTTSPYVWNLGILPAGDYTLLARAVPLDGVAVIEEITIKVLGSGENGAPSITGLAASPTTLTLPANTTELTATAEDPDGDILTYTWSGDTGVTFAPTVAATTTATLPSAAGTYTIQLVVTDGNGGRATRSTAVTVNGGGGVGETTVSFDSPTNGAELPDDQPVIVNLIGSATDGVKSMSLSVNGEWKLPKVITTAPFQWDLGTLPVGEYDLLARLVTLVDEAVAARIKITVVANGGNHAPTITTLTPSSTTLTLPENTIDLTATANDQDVGDTLTYSWSGADVTFVPTGGAMTTATLPSVAGTYNIQLLVTDDKGGRATRSVDIEVIAAGGGGDLTVSFDSPTNNAELPNGQAVVVTVNAGPDGDIAKVRLKLNGVWEIDDTTSPYVWNLGVLEPGEHTLVARAVPSVGEAVVETIKVRVLGAGENSSPSITGLEASAETVTLPANTIELTATANDQDEGDTLRFAWSGAGVTFAPIRGARTTATLPSAAGTYEIQLEVTDGNGGAANQTVQIVVRGAAGGENQNPTITRLTASPATLTLPVTTTELTAIAGDLDEGDTLRYSWSGAGVSFDPAAGARTTATLPPAAGTYNIQLEVTDGNGGRAIRSVTVEVMAGGGGGGENSSPTITRLTASPATLTLPATTTELTAIAGDLDGDTLRYSWSGAGVTFDPAIGPTTRTTATLPSTAGTYEVQLVVTDDNGGTATSSVNIVISDASIDGGDDGGVREDSDDDGCGCSAAPGSNGTTLLVLIVLGLVFYRKRLSLKKS